MNRVTKSIDNARCTALLEQLVDIESYSRNESHAVEFLVDAMAQHGYTQSYVDSAGNAIGIAGNPAATTTIMLLGHIDTVAGKIPVRIENGVLYGRGSVDAKGPLATFFFAGTQAEIPDYARIVVCGAVEEESATSKGARQIATDFHPDYCVIGEPSSMGAITLGYKGRLLVDYDVSVDEGHSAGPGNTAAEFATAFWYQVLNYSGKFNAPRNKLFDQLLPSLRSIKSSSDGMTGRANATIGCRLPPDFDIAEFTAFLRLSAGNATIRTYGHEPAYASNRSNELVRALGQAIRKHGLKPAYKKKTGTSDMNVVGPKWQCPIVAYGPGDSSLDHTPNEHLHLEEYFASIEILKSALEFLMQP